MHIHELEVHRVLKLALTSGAFLRVHISFYYNVKTKQSKTFTTKLPATYLDCPAVRHTYISVPTEEHIQKQIEIGDIFSQHSVA